MIDPSLSIVEPGFAFEPSQAGEMLVVRFSGNADMTVVKTLAECLRKLHAEALRLAVREVVCDFAALYFMNSSSFKAFVTWIMAVEALESDVRYTIRFRSNRQLHWQKRSLEALRCLAESVVSVETPGS